MRGSCRVQPAPRHPGPPALCCQQLQHALCWGSWGDRGCRRAPALTRPSATRGSSGTRSPLKQSSELMKSQSSELPWRFSPPKLSSHLPLRVSGRHRDFYKRPGGRPHGCSPEERDSRGLAVLCHAAHEASSTHFLQNPGGK